MTFRWKARPEEDKQITIEIELHKESELDAATYASTRVFSGKDSYIDVGLRPIDASGNHVNQGHILRSSPISLSRYAADGYWIADQIKITDANGNKRFSGQKDFGWQLYIDNPLADDVPPVYVPNSVQLSLADARTSNGRFYQILTVEWRILEKIGIQHVSVSINDENTKTYSLFGYGSAKEYDAVNKQWIARVHLDVADHWQTGIHKVQYISMRDIAKNPQKVYFSDYTGGLSDTSVQIDEIPASIYIQTTTPDSLPPELDLNRITVNAKPTRPEAPNGETIVDITFRAKDNISGVHIFSLYLRDPNGERHHFWGDRNPGIYFQGDPSVYQTYHKTIVLPIGSIPGTWGLAELNIQDKAKNKLRADFTEIVRFEVTDTEKQVKYDLNADGNVNVLDLVIVSQAIGNASEKDEGVDADINADGAVNVLDLVQIANQLSQ